MLAWSLLAVYSHGVIITLTLQLICEVNIHLDIYWQQKPNTISFLQSFDDLRTILNFSSSTSITCSLVVICYLVSSLLRLIKSKYVWLNWLTLSIFKINMFVWVKSMKHIGAKIQICLPGMWSTCRPKSVTPSKKAASSHTFWPPLYIHEFIKQIFNL